MQRLQQGIATALLFGLIGLAWAEPKPTETKKFEGEWFTIRYPATFKARPGIKESPETKSNSAFFASPDKHVEFYVFSPQWNGEPTDYALDTQREVVVQQQEQNTKQKSGAMECSIRVKWMTVRAKNHSYTRSWVDTENVTLNVRLVFGIKYTDQAGYAKYRQQYDAFKKSLEQFSD